MHICSIKGCNSKHVGNGLCRKHYDMVRRQGYVKERTMFDRNEIVIGRLFCWMKLYNKKGEEVATTVFDHNIYEKVKNLKWHKNPDGYVVTYQNKKYTQMAYFVLNVPKGLIADHKNRNKLDNRKQNLRVCTCLESTRNRGLPKNNTSGYIGLTFVRDIKKWLAQIWVNGKSVNLGYFTNKEEAAYVRDLKAKEVYGEFAVLNNVIPRKEGVLLGL